MKRQLKTQKRIALVAHDAKKSELIRWCEHKRAQLSSHQLFATGTTAARLSAALDLPVQAYLSGPMGAISRSGQKLLKVNWICWCFSGIP